MRPQAHSLLAPGARCPRHEGRPATGVCFRCGDYLCGACVRRIEDRLCCVPCAERTTEDHSRRSVQAFVLGLISVHGIFVLAPLAAVLAYLELSAIEAGQAPLGGRGLCRVALGLGVCGLLMPISLALVFFATSGVP